jgi:transcription elongation factor GreA
MDAKKIYLTKEGLEELKKEYDELSKKRRPQIVERLSSARDQGDLSENAEYQAAREELSFVDGRIDELEEVLKDVVIIEDKTKSRDKGVALGSKVTVKIDGTEEIYTVVGEFEADPTDKKISHESPLGKALIGKDVGEQIEVEAPAGKIVYTIVRID